MSGCLKCGARTTRRYCRHCERQQSREARTGSSWTSYDCPDCGGDTSGQGVTCYLCRGGN